MQVASVSRIKTDQPKVVSMAKPSVVTSTLMTSTGANLPAVQAAKMISSRRIITGKVIEGWIEMSTIRDNLTMNITDPLELKEDDSLQTDRYMGAYLDFCLPSDGHPRISEVFYANTQLIPNDNYFPLTLIYMPEWEREYHTAMFGVD